MEKAGVCRKIRRHHARNLGIAAQFDNRRGARPHRLLAQARFRAAYDFLMLRAQLGQAARELADWWTTFQHADEN